MNVANPEVLIIGAGPGGYVAAIRLGQLGKKVLVVDRERVGGVCLNHGCIPTKALLYAGQIIRIAGEAGRMGIKMPEPELDLPRLNNWKSNIIERLVKGIESLFKSNGVQYLKAEACFLEPKRILLQKENGERETVAPEAVIIATGSEPFTIPGFPFDGGQIISSDEAIELKNIPDRLLVIGAGAVGLELASIYARLGSKVTVVEIMDQVLPGLDSEIAQVLLRALKRQGIEILLETTAKEVKKGTPLEVVIAQQRQERVAKFDKILVAVGRRPSISALDLDKIGVAKTDKEFIKVNERRQTSVTDVYAIGDVVGPPLLAHKAMREGIVAAEVIAGLASAFDPKGIPNCVFTEPEVATVGLSEQEATDRGYEVAVGRFPLLASGRALTLGQTQGLAKVVADRHTDLILGIHILAPEASSLIGEGVLGIELGATAEDLGLSIHPHPTLGEILMEAAENLHQRAIHIPNQ